jgi:hypothetical protein
MAVTYANGVKTARMQAVLDAIDAGTAAKLEIGTSGMAAVLATLTLVDPAGTVSGSVLTLDFSPAISAVASGTGTAAAARIRTSADADVVTGLTVGTSGTDIVLDSTSITSGQTVTISAGTLTHG